MTMSGLEGMMESLSRPKTKVALTYASSCMAVSIYIV